MSNNQYIQVVQPTLRYSQPTLRWLLEIDVEGVSVFLRGRGVTVEEAMAVLADIKVPHTFIAIKSAR